MPAVLPGIRCRQIRVADIDGVVNLLTRGMRIRTREFWVHAFRRLTEHSTPPGFPKYGYLLEHKEAPVGVILLIFSPIFVDGEVKVRCSVSSWYVDPSFRSYAAMLAAHALAHNEVTYFNITPDPRTLAILEAQRWMRYSGGRFVAVPALSPLSSGARIERVARDIRPGEDLQAFEAELLLKHADYGCVSLTCSLGDRRYPFIFLPLRKAGVVRFAYLVYCRHLEDFVRFAGPLGRFLALRGTPLVVFDANGAIDRLVGKYLEGSPKYFKGPNRPRLGDWAYSERVMFGY